MKEINFYGKKLNAFKANFHTHSTNSDGHVPPAEVIERYAAAGYDILALTDHGKITSPADYDNKGMLLIPSSEVHPNSEYGPTWHIVALNLPEDFPYCVPADHNMSAQQTIDAINAAGGAAALAHPYWSSFGSVQLHPLKNYFAIEIYNTECQISSREYSMQTWDEMLKMGDRVNAIAVDDMHNLTFFAGGWTFVCAEERTIEAVMQALKAGNFYASQGPEFKSLSFENGIFHAEFTEATGAWIFTRKQSSKRFINPIVGKEQIITELTFDTSELAPGDHIRCQIKDRNGKFAWTNPIYI